MPPLETYAKWLEAEIKKQQFGKKPQSLYEPIRYLMSLGGKRLRPMLTLLSYKLFKDDFVITSALFNYYNTALKHKQSRSRSASSARRTTYHKIRSGDTISEIARKYGVSQSQIMRLNKINAKTTLRLGRSLRIR